MYTWLYSDVYGKHPTRSCALKPQLGATKANSERSAEAQDAYRRSLELRPGYTRALINMGIAETNLMNYDEATKLYIQALKATPTAL